MDRILLLDTDVLIDYLRGVAPAIRFIEESRERQLVSVIGVAELHAGVKGEEEETKLADFVASFEVVDIDLAIAQLGGSFRNRYFKSHGVGLADALIAASSVQRDACLTTLNQKHFPMLSEVEVPYQKI